MGLDVYVGPLTRYHLGDWETIVQQSARREGDEVQVIRSGVDGTLDPAMVKDIVLNWRERITKALGEKLSAPLDWDENAEGDYFTDKPAWDCYSDLVLWAAYDEQPSFVRPNETVEKWTADPALQASNVKGFNSRYGQLLKGVELWLPAEFNFTFRAKDAVGNVINLGSSITLLKQLVELNERTWKATPEEVQRWLEEGAEEGASLEEGARFGFAVFQFLAEKSAQHKLPMILDY
jgi:hypothetical protein